MQVVGGSRSFNAVSTMRLFGRWMRMLAKVFNLFDPAGRCGRAGSACSPDA